MCLISVQWVLFGYSLAFGPDNGAFIGDLDWAWLPNVIGAGAQRRLRAPPSRTRRS